MAGHWEIPLGRPPRITSGASNAHPRHGIERYCLDDFWCLNLFRGHGELRTRGERHAIVPGTATITVPGVPHEYEFDGHIALTYIHFELAPGARKEVMPVTTRLGEAFGDVVLDVRQAIAQHPLRPERASARLWEILWRLRDSGEPIAEPRAHPALERALQAIARRLPSAVPTPWVVARAGVSHTHLNRLFQARFGCSVATYVRNQRLERALHLLRDSDRSIASIAYEVGVPDLHAFNKLIRRRYALPPSALRRG